jgi:hypothetical protein
VLASFSGAKGSSSFIARVLCSPSHQFAKAENYLCTNFLRFVNLASILIGRKYGWIKAVGGAIVADMVTDKKICAQQRPITISAKKVKSCLINNA